MRLPAFGYDNAHKNASGSFRRAETPYVNGTFPPGQGRTESSSDIQSGHAVPAPLRSRKQRM